jgi:hypothetical protein
LHKLLIGDKRAVIKNTRAYKLLYIYQNGRALDDAKSYAGSNYALPELSIINATIDAEGDDLLYDVEADDIVNGTTIDKSTLTDDEEVQEVIDAMDGFFDPFIQDDERDIEGYSNGTDEEVEDIDDGGTIDTGSTGTSEGSKHTNVRGRQLDVTSSCKKRARALNDAANDVEWMNDYGFGEGGRQQATRAVDARGSLTRGGRGRGRVRGRGVPHVSPPDFPELTPFELQRQQQIIQNAAIIQQQLGDFRGFNPLNSRFGATMGGIGWQPLVLPQHATPHIQQGMHVHVQLSSLLPQFIQSNIQNDQSEGLPPYGDNNA